ncbi:MAG TPA: ABC transporter transmembrane domain-containing protein [Vicinamibacterales bacterium]|nr:ABC transporter transmembrane domain-containing protein [Vicinamibacterales bacterium]
MLPLSTQLRRIATVVWTERRLYLPGTLFVLLSIGTGLGYPQIIRLIIDEGVQGRQLDRLNQLALIMVGILIVEAISTAMRDYCFNLGAERVGLRLRRMVFETLLRQDVQFFDRRDTGEITTRLSADVPALQFVLGEEFADAIRFSIIATAGTALLFYTSARLSMLTLLAVPPIIIATSYLGRKVRGLASDVQQAHADAGAAASEVIAGIRTVRAFGQEAAESTRYERSSARALEFARRKITAHSILDGVSFVAGECAALLAIWVGGHLIVTGRLTTGSLLSFVLYALLVARGFRNASRFAAESYRAIGATQWIFDLLHATPTIPLSGGKTPAELDGSVAFEQLRFRYPTRTEVEALKGIDLSIRPGEVIALVGKSGSGKSTLLNLLLRFYDPTEGRVVVGGHDVRDLDPQWLRAQIATVQQDPTLFSRSIAENIAYGVDHATVPEIAAAATLASVDEYIHRLPDGYETQIGDRGVQLSGGQRQRLAIARAILRRPKILILDEATSALDAELESIVQNALRSIDYRPTTIIIAHRLSTVAHVNRVIVLDQGLVVETGTHDELIQTSRFYRQLVQTQLVAQ